jgi:hypothetical protein
MCTIIRDNKRRQFLGKGALNTPTNFLETVFSVESVPMLYNTEFQVISQS